MQAFRQELTATRMSARLQTAKLGVGDGVGAPVITDGPFREMKELLPDFG
jgi:hypothetical protein